MGKDNLLGSFEELVLLAVARGSGEGYGMTLRREIEERTGREVTIGAVYATLDRLEAKGLVESHFGFGDDVRGGRARRLFRIRTAGVSALASTRDVRSGLWKGLDLAGLVDGKGDG